MESNLQELSLEIKSNTYRLEALSGNTPLPATSQLIPVRAIAEALEKVDWARQESTRNRKGQLDKAQLDADINLEKAEQNRIIDFIQMRYNGPHTDIFQERLNIGMGFGLPHSASKKLKLEELRVEQLLLGQELWQQKTLDSLKILRSTSELNVQIEQWKLYQKKLDAMQRQWKALREKGLDIAYASPDAFLFQQETLLKAQLKIRKLEEAIYSAYLSLLEQSGVLGRERNLQYILQFITR